MYGLKPVPFNAEAAFGRKPARFKAIAVARLKPGRLQSSTREALYFEAGFAPDLIGSDALFSMSGSISLISTRE